MEIKFNGKYIKRGYNFKVNKWKFYNGKFAKVPINRWAGDDFTNIKKRGGR